MSWTHNRKHYLGEVQRTDQGKIFVSTAHHCHQQNDYLRIHVVPSCSRNIQKHPEVFVFLVCRRLGLSVLLQGLTAGSRIKQSTAVQSQVLRIPDLCLSSFNWKVSDDRDTRSIFQRMHLCCILHLWHPGDLDLNFKLLFGKQIWLAGKSPINPRPKCGIVQLAMFD